jgi:hypothetical protein
MTTKTTATFAPAPEGSGTPFGTTSLHLASQGYVEEEYSASGTANRYRMNFTSTDGAGGTAGQPDDPLATAEVVDAGHPYTTRILVRRPSDAGSFNGTVIVEWFNVSLSQDVDFVFTATHDYLLSNGYAWVGVSAQLAGTNALKQANAARYSNLNLGGCRAEMVTIDPHTLAEVDESILRLGEVTGRRASSRALVSSIQQRMTQFADRVKVRPRPRVAVLEWTGSKFDHGRGWRCWSGPTHRSPRALDPGDGLVGWGRCGDRRCWRAVSADLVGRRWSRAARCGGGRGVRLRQAGHDGFGR